jgi:tRNA-Thr(GGU) m(6)t(6)A37 methyltransferase TsaA
MIKCSFNRLEIGCCVFLICFGALNATPAFAHKMYVFAISEGSTIHGEVYFQDNVPALQVKVTVLDSAGEVLGETTTDANGKFSFTARFRCDHRLLAEAGPGHAAEFIVEAASLPENLPPRERARPKGPEDVFRQLDANGDGKLTPDEFKGMKDMPAAGTFTLRAIGRVKKTNDRCQIVLNKKYEPGLLGLDQFSHVYVFYWLDRNDTPERRSLVQFEPHPPGDIPHPPHWGVFASRFPCRPNLIGMTLCKIVSIKENVIEIAEIDAFTESAVLDLKPYMPGFDMARQPRLPDWMPDFVKKRPE